MKMDLICPMYWVNESLFEANLKSWLKELPINRILLGVNNLEVIDYLNELDAKYDLMIIDQLSLKTLGGCLIDLMDQVKTKWFVYVHSDIRITPFAFEIMKHYIKPEIGIIESERLHWDGAISENQGYKMPFYNYSNYYNIDRSFSGFQIIQKKAIESTLKLIEDDFLYRNEDLIFHYYCLMNGYRYMKTFATHIHQNFEQKWTFSKEEAYRMQFKGLVKYTEPFSRITDKPCLNAIGFLKSQKLLTLYDAIKVCDKYKKKRWKRLIIKKWDVI